MDGHLIILEYHLLDYAHGDTKLISSINLISFGVYLLKDAFLMWTLFLKSLNKMVDLLTTTIY